MKPMTKEQRKLAEDNHELVYAFLDTKQLSEDLYYDVVIFGYLRAAQEYCEKPRLRKRRFSTIAWRKMQCELQNYLRYLASQKRRVTAVSIHDPVSEDSPKRWEEVLADPCDALSVLEIELALQSLALSHKERTVARRKRRGESMHSIAKAERLTFQQINSILQKVKKQLIKTLYFLIWRLL